jgi:hypothetical protein
MYEESQDGDGIWGFYFALKPRSIITIPLLLLMSINVIYHIGMITFIQIDLFIGNFIVWIFFGQAIGFTIQGLAVTTAGIPIAILPSLWHTHKIWGILKIAVFLVCLIVTTLLTSYISAGALWLLDVFADLRTTLWWSELWG